MEKIKDKHNLILETIEKEKYPQEIKEELIDVSNKIIKITEYEYSIPDIIVNNYNRKALSLYKTALSKILKQINDNLNIIEYNLDFNYKKISKLNDIVLIIDDIDFFCENEEYSVYNFLKLVKNKKISYILLSEKEKFIPNKFLDFFEKLISGIYIKISNANFTVDEIYKKLLSGIGEKNIKLNVSEDKTKKLISNLLETGYFNNSECANSLISDFIKLSIITETNEISEKDFTTLYKLNFDIPQNEPNVIIDTKKSLKKMVGLKNVKEELNNLENYLSFMNKCKNKPDKMYLNLFFLGNPGSGKTTVARMFKDILFKLKYIKEDKITEIVPNDLIGRYVGETRHEIRKLLEKAKGGLLFIDEAYLLYSTSYKKNGQNPYMEEALVELMKYMEDPENIIIFAGYPEKMLDIYNANPGMKSRIFKEIEFEDYTSDELFKILVNKLSEYDIKIDNNAKKNIIKHLEIKRNDKNFGNARYIEKFAQILINNHANRKLKIENFIIDENDIPKTEKDNKNVRKIGFIGD